MLVTPLITPRGICLEHKRDISPVWPRWILSAQGSTRSEVKLLLYGWEPHIRLIGFLACPEKAFSLRILESGFEEL
jgi:hypothetical protein